MASKIINISLDERLVTEIDKAAKADYTSRSNFIRNSVLEKIAARKGQKVAKTDSDYALFVKQYEQTLKNLADR